MPVSSSGRSLSSFEVIGTPGEHLFAWRMAADAGDLLLRLRAALMERGQEEEQMRREADRLSHEFLLKSINAAYPEDAVLSEEVFDDPSRLTADRVWIIDPLDGGPEFAEEGRTDWAVHVALAISGHLVAGAVSLPARALTVGTWPPAVAVPRRPGPLRIAVNRSRPPELAHALAARLGADLVPLGSAGAKTLAVLQGEADVYMHAGGQWEWDSAAPVAVARAAGLHASRLDGSPLVYNQASPWLPDILVARPADALRALAAIRELIEPAATVNPNGHGRVAADPLRRRSQPPLPGVGRPSASRPDSGRIGAVQHELRRWPRLQAPVFYRLAGPSFMHHRRSPVDVSFGGMRVHTDEAMREGQRLELDVLLPEQETVRLWAEVVWKDELKEGDPAKYAVGLRFVDYEPADYQRLASVLSRAEEG